MLHLGLQSAGPLAARRVFKMVSGSYVDAVFELGAHKVSEKSTTYVVVPREACYSSGVI